MSTILLVDDNAADRAVFRRILGGGGHVVHEVVRGSEVSAKVEEVQPHVIVLDVNLPDADGHEVCRALRRSPITASIPILMLTVRDRQEDVIAGLTAGADDYVAKDEAGQVILARVNRLAEHRKLAAVAILNQQLAQVGRLLAGIVHEIRAPLTVIRGHAELIQVAFGHDPTLREYVEPILQSALLLQSRLEHLMAAVRTGPVAAQVVDIGPLVREASDLFGKGIDPRQRRVRVRVEIPEHLPRVLADPGRLIQVLLNLLANAHDAILAHREAGEIEVIVEVEPGVVHDSVLISVRDDGPGILPQHLARIFEPFFTTKEGGSGYGLYLAQEIVRQQGGRIDVSNIEAKGACFTVRLSAVTVATVPRAEL